MEKKCKNKTFDKKDYQVVKKISEDNNTKLGCEKKNKTSISIKKSNSKKLDDIVKKFNAKSRSVIIDMLIEKSEL